MSKVAIERKFHTSIGLILMVKNNRVYKVGDVINTNDGEYRIDALTHTSNSEYAGLIVTKVKAEHNLT